MSAQKIYGGNVGSSGPRTASGASRVSQKASRVFSAIHSFIEMTFALCRANGFRNRFFNSSLASQSASRMCLRSTV